MNMNIIILLSYLFTNLIFKTTIEPLDEGYFSYRQYVQNSSNHIVRITEENKDKKNIIANTFNCETKTVSSNGGNISNGKFEIPSGNHIVKITNEKGAWLTVGDNTELVINGNVQLEGNNFLGCDIIRVTGNNVFIHGNGSIIGDRSTHKGEKGEWGMGIRLHNATNVELKDLTVSDCWGDCIYIGGKSEKINIENCELIGSRRQGISITNANGVTINNCRIANISGTMPQYAIDIEPNYCCVVDNILISNVNIKNCEGGFRAIIGKKGVGNASINRVELRGCNIMAKSRHSIQFAGCQEAIVKNCIIEVRKREKPIIFRHGISLIEENNKVIFK